MKKRYLQFVFSALVGISGCSVGDIKLADETAYNKLYAAYKSAEESKNSSALRAVAEEFLAQTEKYPASGTVDDAYLYRARALIYAAEYDTNQAVDNAKKEYRLAEQALAQIPDKSSKHLASIYYHGYAEYRIWGKDSLETNSRQTALDLFNQLHSTAPKHDNAPGARYYSGQIYRKMSQDSLALVWFDRSVTDTAVSSFGKSAVYWGAVCSDSLKDTASAITRYERYLLIEPSGSYAASAYKRLAEIDPSPEKSAYASAFALYAAGEYALSADAFSSYLKTYPGSTRNNDAQYYLGRSAKAEGEKTTLSATDRKLRLAQAVTAFGNVTGDRVELSRYYAGSCSYAHGQLDPQGGYFDSAIVYHGKVLSSNPSFQYSSTCIRETAFAYRLKVAPNFDSSLVWFEKIKTTETGMYWSAVNLQDLKRNSEAVIRYDSYVSTFTSGSYASASLFGSAYCSYLQGDTTTSAGKAAFESGKLKFDQFIKTYSSSDSLDNARLYGGHCYRKTGDRTNAALWYEAGISAGDSSKKGDCVYWAGVLFDQLNDATKQKLYLNQYIVEYDKQTKTFDDAAYYADAKKRLGL